MSAIGNISGRVLKSDALARGRLRAALIPDCLVEAQRVANIVIAGWHGRRKRGTGDNFWQFRQFTQGENYATIDWRKSARDDHLYVRDKEWETAHTVWLWADMSPSMWFRSEMTHLTKESRGLVILFAMAEILSRSGERIGIPGLMDPILARDGAERMAQVLIAADDDHPQLKAPDLSQINRLSDVILISDFLDDGEKIIETCASNSRLGIRGHLVEVCDPAEEVFPYTGRTEFIEPERRTKFLAGRAASLADDYVKAYQQRRLALSEQVRRFGWSFTTHRTDRLASDALAALYGFLTGAVTAPPNMKTKSQQGDAGS